MNAAQSLTPELITALQTIVGADKVKCGADDLDTYGKDWTRVYPPAPSAIVFPKTTQQVQALVLLPN